MSRRVSKPNSTCIHGMLHVEQHAGLAEGHVAIRKAIWEPSRAAPAVKVFGTPSICWCVEALDSNQAAGGCWRLTGGACQNTTNLRAYVALRR